eukprot:5214018-Amphidinium_carterae.1
MSKMIEVVDLGSEVCGEHYEGESEVVYDNIDNLMGAQLDGAGARAAREKEVACVRCMEVYKAASARQNARDNTHKMGGRRQG